MRALIIGGGKVGYNLFRTLHERGHCATLVERDKEACMRAADSIGADVIQGDGTDPEVLKDAGIDNAEIVAAVTGSDEENLVICQIAKLTFNINKTIARVNNPKNIEMFRLLGIDTTVCSTAVIATLIENELNRDDIKIVSTFERGSMVLAEVALNQKMVWDGQRIADLTLPEACVFASVLRGNRVIYPKGDTVLYSGDRALLVTNTDTLSILTKEIYGGVKKWKLI